MSTSDHWDAIYARCGRTGVSWYRDHLDVSLALIGEAKLSCNDRILDVGGGASTLVDDLLARGHRTLSVVDLSAAALEMSRRRLGALAGHVTWLHGDIRHLQIPWQDCALWHDRAVFHFLTDADERAGYLQAVARAVRRDGYLVMGAFSPDGPRQCSGLDVVRYNVADLCAAVGSMFRLIRS